jgi:small nuclear ribonucleoprotein (snRNP)-like protein
MSGNIGVPIKLLYEAEGMKITVEMKNGEIYRGLLLGAEDTMNVSLSDVLRTARNGHISKLPNVYLRGSSIRFIALPDLLKSAPIFQKVQTQKRKLEESIAQRQGGTKKRKLEPWTKRHMCMYGLEMKKIMYKIYMKAQATNLHHEINSIVYRGFCGVSGRYNPNLFLHATLCRLNLSSGENRAGCALSVRFFVGDSFCLE